METVAHNPTIVASPAGGYSHGLEIRDGTRMLFISGQIPTLPDGQVPAAFADQCHVVWHNILVILASTSMAPANIVKLTTYLTDREQATLNGDIRRTYLGSHQPALTVVVAQTLAAPWLLEIEAIAMG